MHIKSKSCKLKLLRKLIVQHGIKLGLARGHGFKPHLHNLHVCFPICLLDMNSNSVYLCLLNMNPILSISSHAVMGSHVSGYRAAREGGC